ncbi:MAG: hypothetical protein IT458_18750 [Planctomycetes bacterium]|nr:hypothetical protein [Planctomycetota bacterium]
MTPAGSRWFRATVLAASATGAILLWTRYVAAPPEETDPPAIDATAQHLHVLLVPFLVFGLGVLWPTHVLPALRVGNRLRRTGLLLLALTPPMVLTGYAMQVATEESWRSLLGWAHALTGTAWAGVFVVHLLAAWWSLRAGRPRECQGVAETPGSARGGRVQQGRSRA